MCGIAGIFAFNVSGGFDESLVRRMVEVIRHRGPDESEVFAKSGAGLGISRLAIIDPEGSHQPLRNEDGSVFMVFNGEIYNYRDLRRELENAGHRFASKGDGEVIVHGYEEWGEDVFVRLRGMFAVAIYDDSHDRLLLARDRVGIKPLYVYSDGNRFLFASEIKSLLAAGVEARMRPELLDCYLTFRYVPAPDTIFEGIRKLPPGELLTVDAKGETRRRFHDYRLTPKHAVTEAQAIVSLKDLLTKSVEYRLQADVPLGVFLSGGLDSGFLVALVREHTAENLDTFSIGFNRPGIYDETEAAAVVVRRYSTNQHVIKMDHVDFAGRLAGSVYHMDEPMADPSSVPMQALSELAGRHVKVVLSGEGGDELFAGYGRYLGESLASRFTSPEAVSRWLARALRKRVSRRVRRGIQGLGIADARKRHLFWEEIVAEGDRRRLLEGSTVGEDGQIDPLRLMAVITGELDERDDMDRLFYFDMRAWLVEDLLLKKDKMGMSASIEARVPYLDQDVVDYALRLPVRMKIQGKTGKVVFRKLLDRHLPPEILSRPKVGFAVPIASWFRNELYPMIKSRLTDDGSFIAGIFDKKVVSGLIDAHRGGEDQSVALYSLLILDLWGRVFLSGESPQELSTRILHDISK